MNPYKKGPVKSSKSFFGFKQQQKSMKNWIDQSINGSSTNLLCIGEPSAGKSSFLNITREYCNEIGFLSCEVDVNIETSCYKFFDEVFKSILGSIIKNHNSRSAIEMLKIYENISNTGNGKCDLSFPSDYYNWKKLGENFESFPSISTIRGDFDLLFRLYNSSSKDNHNKIAVFIDDFQKIIGHDEHGEISDEAKIEQLHKNANSITEALRKIIENYDEYYLFVIATYPKLVQDEKYELPQKLLNRHFEHIELVSFDKQIETGELIQESLKQLPDDHPWKVTYYSGDFDLIDQKPFYDETQFKIFREFEIYKLGKMVHDESKGRPFPMKLLMQQIFDTFPHYKTLKEDSKDINPDYLLLIDFNDSKKFAEIYSRAAQSLKRTDFPEKLDNYSDELILHLYIFSRYSSFTIDDIITYFNYEMRVKNIIYFDKQDYDLTAINDDKVNNFYKIFDNSKVYESVVKQKLELSLEKFIADEILIYNESATVKYELKLTVYNFNYLQYFLKSKNFPNLDMQNNHELELRDYLSPLLNNFFGDKGKVKGLRVRPDVEAFKYQKFYKVICQDISSLTSIPDRIVDRRFFEFISDGTKFEIWQIYIHPSDSDQTVGYFFFHFNHSTDFRENAFNWLTQFESNNRKIVCKKIGEVDPVLEDQFKLLKVMNDLPENSNYNNLILEHLEIDGIYKEFYFRDDYKRSLKTIDFMTVKIDKIVRATRTLEDKYLTYMSDACYLYLNLGSKKKVNVYYSKIKTILKYGKNEKLNNFENISQLVAQYNFIIMKIFAGKYSKNNIINFIKIITESTDSNILESITAKDNGYSMVVLTGEKQPKIHDIVPNIMFDAIYFTVKSAIFDNPKLKISKKLVKRIDKIFKENIDNNTLKNYQNEIPTLDRFI